jgi:hypothetical protein
MNNQVLPVGSRVRVISYSPFRGLIGTIRTVDTIPDLGADEAFCFYLVELEGTHSKDPIWFECDEVELVSPLGGTLSDACGACRYPL